MSRAGPSHKNILADYERRPRGRLQHAQLPSLNAPGNLHRKLPCSTSQTSLVLNRTIPMRSIGPQKQGWPVLLRLRLGSRVEPWMG